MLDVQKPLLASPSFATPAWVLRRIAVTPKTLRHLQKEHAWICAVSGYPDWPEQPPDEDEFAHIMAKGFSYPLFLWAANFAGGRQWPNVNHMKRKTFSLFKPIQRKLFDQATNILRRESGKMDEPRNLFDDMRRLLASDDSEAVQIGVEAAFLTCAMHGRTTEIEELASLHHQAFEPLATYLASIALHLPDAPVTLASRIAKNGYNEQTNGAAGSPEKMDAERHAARWRSAFETIAESSAKAACGEPSADAVEAIRAALEQAASAFAAWDALQPKTIDARPLVEHARIALMKLRTLAAAAAGSGGRPLGLDAAINAFGEIEGVAAIAAIAERPCLDKKIELERLLDEASMEEREAERLGASGILGVIKAIESLRRIALIFENACGTLCGLIEIIGSHAAEQRDAANAPPAQIFIPPPFASTDAIEREAMDTNDREPVLTLKEAEQELAAALESSPQPSEDSSPKPHDPLVERVKAKIDVFLLSGSYALAYHLVRATARLGSVGDLPISAPELRLAAVAGHVNHVSVQAAQLIDVLTSEALSVQKGAARAGNADYATQLLVFGATVEHALFHRRSAAWTLIQSVSLDQAFSDAVFNLKEAIAAATRIDTPLSVALLQGLREIADAKDLGDERRKSIIEKARNATRMTFNFKLGNKLMPALGRRNGAIGSLLEDMSDPRKTAAGARRFAEICSGRVEILDLLNRTEAEINGRSQGVDGVARERIIGQLAELAALCADYVEREHASPLVQEGAGRDRLLQIRATLLTAIDAAEQGVKAIGDDETRTPHIRAAAFFVTAQLARLRRVVAGEASQAGPLDHLFATYGPLLQIPGLRFASSWSPSPYEPQQIVEGVLSLRKFEASPAFFEEAVQARITEASFIPARALIAMGDFFGASEETRAHLGDIVGEAIGTTRAAIGEMLDSTRRGLENIERTGRPGEQEDAVRLADILERIDLNQLPADIPLEAWTEEEDESERIFDLSAVSAIVDDVRDRTRRINDGPRQALRARLEDLLRLGRASVQDGARIGRLIDADDLITSDEYLTHLEAGLELPRGEAANRRFSEFFPDYPIEMTERGKGAMNDVEKAAQSVTDLGRMRFSRISVENRGRVKNVCDDWMALRRAIHNGAQPHDVFSKLCFFFTRMGVAADPHDINSSPASAKRKIYEGLVRMILPQDPKSNILPDFGSLSRGVYRVLIAAKTPSEPEFGEFASHPSAEAQLVIVADHVTTERRRSLAAFCRDQRRKMLVLDDAIVAFALSEREFRPLTPFELAQPFAFASPYKDYGNGAVPPEVFVGRAREGDRILEPHGSCVVYGGRRLGKTALLRHLVERRHAPDKGVVCSHVVIRNIGTLSEPIERLWPIAAEALPDVFGRRSVKTAHDFVGGARSWLDAGPVRQIILMLDEADNFIAADAKHDFVAFGYLQGLMESTNRRFKVVFAGLHNVTRFVRSGNPPLKQIASDPIRIGPLINAEIEDAERLVTKPLAALGFEFESRELAWRILSRTNYYPVLAHVFCERLLDRLRRRPVDRRGEPPFKITAEDVRNALADPSIEEAIEQKFNDTLEVDDRYKVLANVVANRMLAEAGEGRIDQGVASIDIREDAAVYWPAAFKSLDSLAVVEDLLDEMEGLGILRSVGLDRWTLRSPSIRKLMGDRDRIETVLLNFSEANPEAGFDPRKIRRELKPSGVLKVEDAYPAPLTLGQEHDILTGKTPVSIVFGARAGDIDYVAASLSSDASPVAQDVKTVGRIVTRQEKLEETIREIARLGEKSALIVTHDSPWTGDWVQEALRLRPVRDGWVRVVFVGGPGKALDWVRDVRFRTETPNVRVLGLQPWSDAMVAHACERLIISLGDLKPKALQTTGGFNSFMHQALKRLAHGTNSRKDALDAWAKQALAAHDVLDALGVIPPVRAPFMQLVEYGDTSMTEDDIRSAAFHDGEDDLSVSAFVRYGELLNLLIPEAPKKKDDGFVRRWRPNSILLLIGKI